MLKSRLIKVQIRCRVPLSVEEGSRRSVSPSLWISGTYDCRSHMTKPKPKPEPRPTHSRAWGEGAESPLSASRGPSPIGSAALPRIPDSIGVTLGVGVVSAV